MAYLIDSNVVINYVAENYDSTVLSKLDDVFDTAFNYSVITIMEVMGYNGDLDDMDQFENMFNSGTAFSIDADVISMTISIRKAARIKLPDAIIAATSIVHSCELITENTIDFLKVTGLKVTHPKDVT